MSTPVAPATGRDQLGARVTRAEALARHLETEIAGEELAPGDRLGTKEDLRQRFGVAAATINEAIRLMEMRGLVSARPGPGGGVFVSDISARTRLAQLTLGIDDGHPTLRDCVELRDALEPLICRKAAERVTAADVKAMHKIVDAMEETAEHGSTFHRLNWTLHRAIGDLCDNPLLHSMYRIVVDVLDEGLDDFDFDVTTNMDVAVHRELVDAIGDGSPKRIDAALTRHGEQSPVKP